MQIKFPDEDVFNNLKKGSVLYFINEKFEGRGKDIPHFYVLLNTPINGSLILVMVHASSQLNRIQSIESSEPDRTLIYVESGEYTKFTKSTVFDCNVIPPMTKEKFMEKYDKDQIEIKSDISALRVCTLQKGVLKSRKIELRSKKIIENETEQCNKMS